MTGIVPESLLLLLGEGGFPDEDSLASFALALGVFNDRTGEITPLVERISPESLRSYTLSALILSRGGERDIDMKGMRDLMRDRLAGGFEMIRERVDGKDRISALKELSRTIPHV